MEKRSNDSPSSDQDAEFDFDDEWPPNQRESQEQHFPFAPDSEATKAETGWITVGYDPSDPTYPPPTMPHTSVSGQIWGGSAKLEEPMRPGGNAQDSTILPNIGRSLPSHPLKRPRSRAGLADWPQEAAYQDFDRSSHPKALAKVGFSRSLQSPNRATSQESISSLDDDDIASEYKDSSANMETLEGSGIHARKKLRKVAILPLDMEEQTILSDEQTETQYGSSNGQSEDSQATGESSNTKRRKKNLPGSRAQSAPSDAEGIVGWGWKDRGKNEKVPTFGETHEIQPLFDARGSPVKTTLHGAFQFSRNHKGKVSDDGGPLVHELQKRNIFSINDMAYTLDMPSGASTYPTLRVNNPPQQIHGMFIKLMARSCGSKDGADAPLETRGLSRVERTAKLVHVINELRPRKPDDALQNSDYPDHGYDSSLPDAFTVTHLEFKHATAGNKTTGYWRLDTQDYYRLVLQLCANIGDRENLIVVAESETDRLIVRGRPPGGREAAKADSHKTRPKKTKTPDKKGRSPSPKKVRKRKQKAKDKDDEEDWADDSTQAPIAQGPDSQAMESNASHNSQWSVRGKATATRCSARNTFKRTYNEEADSNDSDSDIFRDESEDDGRPEDYKQSPEVESEAAFETEAQQKPEESVLHGLGTDSPYKVDDEGTQQSKDPIQRVLGEQPQHGHEMECDRWLETVNIYRPERGHGEAFNPEMAPYLINNWLSVLPTAIRQQLPSVGSVHPNDLPKSSPGHLARALPPSILHGPFPTHPAVQASDLLVTQGGLGNIPPPLGLPEATMQSNSDSDLDSDQCQTSSQGISSAHDWGHPLSTNSVFLGTNWHDEGLGWLEELSRHH